MLKRLTPQLLRVMKLTALLLLVASIHVRANDYSQVASFSGKDVALTTVFASMEKQTRLSFFFNYLVIKDVKPVTFEVKDVPLEEAVREALKGQGLAFYRTEKNIFIVKKDLVVSKVDASTGSPIARLVELNAKVTNQEGEALAGATVEMKNRKKVTLTDEKGMFEFKNVSIGAMLEVASSQLDHPQVIAYGTTTDRLSSGNMTTVFLDYIFHNRIGCRGVRERSAYKIKTA